MNCFCHLTFLIQFFLTHAANWNVCAGNKSINTCMLVSSVCSPTQAPGCWHNYYNVRNIYLFCFINYTYKHTCMYVYLSSIYLGKGLKECFNYSFFLSFFSWPHSVPVSWLLNFSEWPSSFAHQASPPPHSPVFWFLYYAVVLLLIQLRLKGDENPAEQELPIDSWLITQGMVRTPSR